MTMPPTKLTEAAEWLRAARRVVVFTGAGISAESGIATFRDADGFWTEFPPERFGNWRGLVQTALWQPAALARFVAAMLEPIATAQPNAGHRAIAALERHTPVTVVTQNIDGLHSLAGSTTVHEIHGTLFEVVTRRGRFVRLLSRPQMLRLVAKLQRASRGPAKLARILLAVRPLLGLGLHGLHRPRVVLFGEGMAQPAWSSAQQAVENCDCLITVGTSEAVMPAAALPMLAQEKGATVIRIDPTPGLADFWLPGPAAQVLPALLQTTFGEGPER